MMNKKVILLFLMCCLFLFLLTSIVSAGCCVYETLGSSCEDKSSVDQCTTEPKEFYPSANCIDLGECQIGCCCNQGTTSGTGTTNYSCASPKTFKLDPDVLMGVSCSCGSGAFSISGTVTRVTGGALSGATVSAGTVTTTTAANGAYTLTSVTGGTNVLVRAFKNDACMPSSINIPNLDSDKTGINFVLNCQCTPETCNATNNAYCKTTGQWQVYDLSIPSQKSTYCSFPQCLAADAECNAAGICIAGDGKCPTACSANPLANNYDPECECDNTAANGVCPPGCDMSNDKDCNVYSPVCGDNLTTYPYETCEQTPDPGQLSLCSADECMGEGETGECNCAGLSGCGNLILETGEECEIGMKCANGSDCEACKCGTPSCTGNNSNPSLALSFDAVNKKIDSGWTLMTSCKPSVIGYSVFRCYKDTSTACGSKAGFSFLTSTNSMNISDSSIIQNAEYCYFVRVNYLDKPDGESKIECKKTGDYYCMESPPPEFCMNNSRSRCDNSYNIVTIEKCNASKHCMGPDRDGKTQCLNQSVCDMCNGLYGMFANLDLGVSLDGDYKYCHPGNGPRVEGCYLDRTRMLFSAFDYCANIITCYDYKSQSACTDASDPCGKNKGCEWVWLDNNTQELGGLCRPLKPTLQKCELCDDAKYNWLSPGCTPQVCSLFGACYFQGTSGVTKSCSKQITAMCTGYRTQQECTGGTAVAIDAIYDATGNRIGGTHTLTPSQDRLSLGKCYWVNRNNGGACYRNADNVAINFTRNTGYDCSSKDYYCESDFTSPVTTILPSTFGVYPANMKVKFSISDNYQSDKIKSYFCVSSSATVCYPTDMVNGSAGFYSKTISSSGTYNLFYYSEDPAKNLEVVKQTQIRVDAERPFIDLTNPANASTFPTNQLSVPVEGITSTDSKYVCAKNTKSGITSCINNCALTGNKTPCFSDRAGIFALTISLSSNTNLTGVVFSAEDYAGNTYSNTLLGILLDIEPPNAPIITVTPVLE